MRVLLIKTSSLGDLFHTLPALSDAKKAFPTIQFDWVVEENFAEVPKWHAAVTQVIPVAIRRWRKAWWKKSVRKEWQQFKTRLQATSYDVIIDAQGLIKSAVLAKLAKGIRVGCDKASLTEPLARFFFDRCLSVDLNRHAIERMRILFAKALGYSLPDTFPDYGLSQAQFSSTTHPSQTRYIVFLHGTTWPSKHWPDEYWMTLSQLWSQAGYLIYVPWSNAQEYERAERLAAHCSAVQVLPRMTLTEIAQVISNAMGVVAVDTGLGNLAAALEIPVISLYGPTDIHKIGIVGKKAKTIGSSAACVCCYRTRCQKRDFSSFCLASISPEQVYLLLKPCLDDILRAP